MSVSQSFLTVSSDLFSLAPLIFTRIGSLFVPFGIVIILFVQINENMHFHCLFGSFGKFHDVYVNSQWNRSEGATGDDG